MEETILNKENTKVILVDVIHARQKYDWDCGIACVLMVLSREQRIHLLKNLSNVSREEGFGKNTWTIDLCYLLKKYNVSHMYKTITLGVHPGYKGHSFYSNIVLNDTVRVNLRFKKAKECGLNVSEGTVSLEEIIKHIDNEQAPVIVLTNARLLACCRCKFNRLSLQLRSCLPIWPAPAYQGHYVLLVGHNQIQKRLLYRNPSLNDHICETTYREMENARTCYGTDEDVIFICKS